MRLDRLRTRLLGLPLSTKLLLAFALVLLPVLVLLLVGIQDRLTAREQAILDGQVLTAEAVAVQIDDAFDAAVNIGWSVASDPLVQTMDPRILDPNLSLLTSKVARYDSINVFDAQGVNRGWGNLIEPAEPRLNIADRDYFRKAMATNSPVISPVLVLRRPSVVGIVASVPIRDASGRPIGVVNVVTRTDQLASSYEQTRLLAGQSIFLTDRNGQLAFYTLLPNLPPGQVSAYADFEPIRMALAGIPNVRSDYVSPILMDRRLGAFTPTPKYRWAVGVTAPTSSAFAPVQAALRDQLVAFALILLFSAGLAVAFARLLSAPLHRLDEAARELGSGDLSRRVPAGPDDEIGHLGRSFNEMADRLEARQTEVVRLSAEANRRANQLAAVIASMTSAVYVVDTTGKLIDTNPTGLDYFGVPTVSEVPASVDCYREQLAMRHPDGRRLADDEVPLARALDGETFANVEMIVRNAVGEDRLISVSGAPVRDETGAVILGVVVARDVTEQYYSDQERGRLLERERALFDTTRALLREIELARVAETAVERGALALRADVSMLWLAQPERRELELLAHRGLSAAAAEYFSRLSYDSPLPSARAASTGEVQVVADLRGDDVAPLTREAAQRENLTSLISVPLLRRGHLVGVVASIYQQRHDISESDIDFATTLGRLFAIAIENARLFDQVREALRLREEFMATAAHELKTPITIITGYAEILLRLHQSPTLTQRGLEAIDRQAKRIAHLIEDLLAVVRIRPGIAALHREAFDLAALVRARIARAADPTHRLRLEQDGELPVTADAGLIAEVVDHLIENAARYSPPDGQIEVTTRRSPSGAEAVVGIRNFGNPISPERIPHVFEPFFESVPSGEPGYLGLVSLGLYLSKQIVDTHGGRIWLDTRPDGSTVFSFSLPMTIPNR